MIPKQIAKESESSHQAALFAWAALNKKQWPELAWLHHIPNGGSRGDTQKSRMIRGAQLKAQGVRTGVADIFLPVRKLYGVDEEGDAVFKSGLYIEMKKPSEKPVKATSKGGVSDEQREFGDFVKQQGFSWHVCYSWEEARDVLKAYLEL